MLQHFIEAISSRFTSKDPAPTEASKTPSPHPLRLQTGLKLNLGCSSVKLPGLINIDVRKIDLVDYSMDLSRLDLAPESCDVIFSHAFFEHLPRQTLIAHLRDAKESLHSEKGVLCYMGIPNFTALAETYLKHKNAQGPDQFNAFHIYYYLMGNPEGRPECYHEQLHKSVFDPEEVNRLLDSAGFEHYVIFTYGNPTEPYPINLGFFASRNPQNLLPRAQEFLKQFEGRFITRETVQFLTLPKPKKFWTEAPERMKLSKLFPEKTPQRVIFNPLPWGDSGLAIEGEGFVPDAVLYWNETPLITTIGSATFLTANVPKSLFELPGKVSLNLRSEKEKIISNVASFEVSPAGGNAL